MSEIRWQRSDDWIGIQVEDSFVMVSIENGKYVALNQTADAVWQALETPRTESEVCDILQSKFDVPAETCAASVEKALAKMNDLGLAAAR